PAALCKAELATAMPESGGTYIYIDRAFGPILGTITGLGLWLSLLFKSTFALEGFGAYLDVMTEVPIKPVALALLVFITGLNVLGVGKVGKAQMVVVVIALAALVVLAGYGLTVLQPQSVQPEFSGGVGGFWGTVSLVYISYAGVTKVAAIAEEVENPGRNLPIGILLSLFIVTTLYCVVNFVLVNQVPLERLQGDLRPIYTMTREMLGPAVGIGAALLGVLTMTSMSNSGLLAASRFPFAMSRQGALPSVFSYISTRFTTPVPAILLTSGIMALTIVVLDVVTIVKFASALMILGFLEVNITVVALRESSTQWYKPTFRAPLYPLVQIVGVGLSVWLLVMLGVKSLIAAAVVVSLGCALFYFSGKQEHRRGVLGRMGPRRELLKAPVLKPHLVLPK